MAPKKEKNAFQRFLDNLKISYITGKNPIGRVMSDHGFSPSKNVALNIGKMMKVPYDPAMRIRPKDPQQVLRANSLRIGQIERIHNTYYRPRLKLAD